ncbi:MAG: thiol:disulfide interchange protein DsbA/DsbL [Deltaproteobacteria bacterium]|jgi:thiol:disulfide interchange protein DsbA|nr:thiol:disulfide interchange protein DsbA/DsbL [Deltaproteobacteria bacterium]
MRRPSKFFLLTALLVFAWQSGLWAQDNSTAPPAPYKATTEIKSPKRWDDSDKRVELLYFFWYGCPTCAMIDEQVSEMVKTLPAQIRFQRLPAAFNENEDWQSHARLFWALQNLGQEEKLHSAVFQAVQPGGPMGGHGPLQLLSPESQKAFARANKIDPAEFENSLKSPLTYNMMQKTMDYLNAIDLVYVPSFIVNGKYNVTIEPRRPITDFIKEAEKLTLEELIKAVEAQ